MASKKAILLIDMDGVVANWTERLREIFETKYPDRTMLPHEELREFYVEDLHPEEWKLDMIQIMSGKSTHSFGFYAGMKTIPGAEEALKDMEHNCPDFLEPFLCSSPDVEYKDLMCHSEKALWVEETLGNFWTKRMILTRDKTLVRGHFLIDDKPEIKGVLSPTWTHIVYKQPWNHRHPVRFSWGDWWKFKEEVLIPNFSGKGEVVASAAA